MSYYSRYGTDRDKDRERDDYHHRRRDWNGNRGRGWNSYRPYNWHWNRESYRNRQRRDPQVVLVKRTQVSSSPQPVKDEADSRYTSNRYRGVDSITTHQSYYFEDGNHRNTKYMENPNKDGRQNINTDTFQHSASGSYQPHLHVPPQAQTAESKDITTITNELIETCISNFKMRGDYDQIRKECLLDVDTKPAFLNAKAKVVDITSRFTGSMRFLPNLDKSKMRENLKNAFAQSKGYESGLESLVNQILMPKVSEVIRPLVEEEIYRCLNIDRMLDNGISENTTSLEQQHQSVNRNNIQTVVQEISDLDLEKRHTSSSTLFTSDTRQAEAEHITCSEPIKFEPTALVSSYECKSNSSPGVIVSNDERVRVMKPDPFDENDIQCVNELNHSFMRPDLSIIQPGFEVKNEVVTDVIDNLTVIATTATLAVTSSPPPVHSSDVDVDIKELSEEESDCADEESEEESPEFEKLDEISPPRVDADSIPYDSFSILEKSRRDDDELLKSDYVTISDNTISSSSTLNENLSHIELVIHQHSELNKCYFLEPLPMFDRKMAYFSRIPPH